MTEKSEDSQIANTSQVRTSNIQSSCKRVDKDIGSCWYFKRPCSSNNEHNLAHDSKGSMDEFNDVLTETFVGFQIKSRSVPCAL